MKRKIYALCFIIFLLAAGLAAWKLLDNQADYRSGSNYYSSLSDSWVAPAAKKSLQTEAAEQTVSPVVTETAIVSETTTIAKTAPVSETVSVSETSSASETTAAAETATKSETIPAAETAAVTETTVATEIPSMAPETDAPAETPTSSLAPEKATNKPLPSPTLPALRVTAEQAPICVDFDGLREINREIIGWIYCEDSPISYPVLQTGDNEKYLHVQPDGKKNRNGSIFIDCNCERDFTSGNTLVYGHNRKDVMFASLLNYADSSYYEAHPVLWLLTPGADYKIDLIAGFITDAEGWVYTTDFLSDRSRSSFIDRCLSSSNFTASFEPAANDRLITLSTCDSSGQDNRYVVVGVLSLCTD